MGPPPRDEDGLRGQRADFGGSGTRGRSGIEIKDQGLAAGVRGPGPPRSRGSGVRVRVQRGARPAPRPRAPGPPAPRARACALQPAMWQPGGGSARGRQQTPRPSSRAATGQARSGLRVPERGRVCQDPGLPSQDERASEDGSPAFTHLRHGRVCAGGGAAPGSPDAGPSVHWLPGCGGRGLWRREGVVVGVSVGVVCDGVGVAWRGALAAMHGHARGAEDPILGSKIWVRWHRSASPRDAPRAETPFSFPPHPHF